MSMSDDLTVRSQSSILMPEAYLTDFFGWNTIHKEVYDLRGVFIHQLCALLKGK